MNTYLIKLKIRAGEREKSNHKLVDADTKDAAIKEALLNECCGSLEDGNIKFSDGGVYDFGGEFHYSVIGCELVDESHVGLLKSYLLGYSRNTIVHQLNVINVVKENLVLCKDQFENEIALERTGGPACNDWGIFNYIERNGVVVTTSPLGFLWRVSTLPIGYKGELTTNVGSIA